MTRNSLPYIAHQRTEDGAEQSLEEHLLGVAETAKSFSCLVIVNTKKSAQVLYQQCQQVAPVLRGGRGLKRLY